MIGERNLSHPTPPYSVPLEELAPPQNGRVRVRFPCPYCGEILERVALLDQTRWYVSNCNIGHSGIGVSDPSVERVRSRSS